VVVVRGQEAMLEGTYLVNKEYELITWKVSFAEAEELTGSSVVNLL